MQGFNMGRYHAPSSLDASLDVPAKKRARLASSLTSTTKAGPPTIRFEMPFAIWCGTCPSSSTSCLIGQGVRFNALKSKVGNYFSTPIWQFRMKHTACGGWIEIRTDPKSSEYIVTEGARRRDTGSDVAVAERIGGVLVGDEAEQERRRQDAFAAFEGKKLDIEQAKGDARRLEHLKSIKQRDWADTDAANRRLRNTFRVGRKARQKDAEGVERLKDAYALGIELVEEYEGDKRRAAFVEFGDIETEVDGLSAISKPLFTGPDTERSKDSKKRDQGVQSKAKALHTHLAENTRVAMDPFSQSTTSAARLIPGVRRKRLDPIYQAIPSVAESSESNSGGDLLSSESTTKMMPDPPQAVLVDYDSD